MFKLYLGCCFTTLLLLLQLVVHARASTITRRDGDGGRYQNRHHQNHPRSRDSDPLVVDVSSSSRIAYSLNPSFKKPSYMRRMSARRHSPVTDVVLPCMASGVKPITYSWTLNGRALSKKKRLKFNDDRLVFSLFYVQRGKINSAKNYIFGLSNFNTISGAPIGAIYIVIRQPDKV